eukprot:Trichotokara_eunicae@DN2775_c0_g1_i2.p1
MNFGFAIQEFGYKSLSALLTSEELKESYSLFQDGKGGVYCVGSKHKNQVPKNLKTFQEKISDTVWPKDKIFWSTTGSSTAQWSTPKEDESSPVSQKENNEKENGQKGENEGKNVSKSSFEYWKENIKNIKEN